VVHLVEDERVDVAEAERALLEVVHEAAGRGDDDVDPAAHLRALVAVADAAEDGDGAQVGEAGEIAEGGLDLGGELARGLEDEDAGFAVVAEPRQDGQREGRGLAGAGLGGADDVAAAEHDGNRAQLDGRGIGIAGGLDAAEHGFGEIESFERHVDETNDRWIGT
jgi:hypothetical protein